MILLDTCALIFWTIDNKKLSKRAKDSIENASKIAISSISVWEIGIKVKRNKLILPISFDDYVDRLQKISDFLILPVDLDVWMLNIRLNWEHNDPADRTIVATSMLKKCPLLTVDSKILEFYENALW